MKCVLFRKCFAGVLIALIALMSTYEVSLADSKIQSANTLSDGRSESDFNDDLIIKKFGNNFGTLSSGSASSKGNAYAYSSSGNPVLWTLQIPNEVKFTYERNQSALIVCFINSVDTLIAKENELSDRVGSLIASALMLVPAQNLASYLVGLFGVSVDSNSLIRLVADIKAAKSDAETAFGKIVAYSTP